MSRIPKIIHYCWVGGAPKPQSVLYCIESWKKHCPGYEIKEWNETNYDFFKNQYMKEAYEAKKWGFVPDYARLDIVYEHGGIYLDTDVELVQSFDSLLENECFFGFENTGESEFFVNCGHGFGAEPKNEVIRSVRDFYEGMSFYKEDGALNLLASPHYTTQSLLKFGLVQENCDQRLKNIQVYASDVLCPKNFLTGKISKTRRTVSIHHFTASWVDEKIKIELEHQRQVKRILGGRLGAYYLFIESVFDKYGLIDIFTKLPIKLLKKNKARFIRIKDSIPYNIGLLKAKFFRTGESLPVLLDTSACSDNCGDAIIMENCILQLPDTFNYDEVFIPTHRYPTKEEEKRLRASSGKIVCGTNLLSGSMRNYGLWRLSPDVSLYLNSILMGVGFDSYNMESDPYTRKLFKRILSKSALHSVRDSFSEKALKGMGINNVVNTGCPTMWALTKEHCSKIPKVKAKNVICTITDYNRAPELDKKMVEILLSEYDKVYLWLQGDKDFEYVEELGVKNEVILVSKTLGDYDSILAQDDLDYVGTRLHAGIRALAYGHRAIVVSIDNRAECISADTGLPIIKRADVTLCLRDRINEVFETKLSLPWDNIKKWKESLSN